jgi:NAD(P)-dependent dehydrogenase (short-subunit alcohol dehydrogenase family)
MIDTKLQGRVVLVSGANYGIGAAIAKAFAAEGAKVFITYLRQSPQDFGIDEEEAQKATEPGLPLYHTRQSKPADEVVHAIGEIGGQAGALEAALMHLYKIAKTVHAFISFDALSAVLRSDLPTVRASALHHTRARW